MNGTPDQRLSLQEYIDEIRYFVRGLQNEERQRLANNIRRYFSPTTTLQLIEENRLADLIAERELKHETSVVIIDIRNFVRTVRMIENDRNGLRTGRDMLHDFFQRAVNIVFRYQGMMGEFAGDRIMAVFGVPIYQNDHYLRALHMAVELEESIEKMNQLYRRVGKINVGIGIHTGRRLYIGDVGASWRRELIIIGSIVNVASRIEDLTKDEDIIAIPGHNILVSETTAQKLAGQADLAEVGTYPIRGFARSKDNPEDTELTIYKVSNLAPDCTPPPAIEQRRIDNDRQIIADISEYIESFETRERAANYREAISNISQMWGSSSDQEDILNYVLELACNLLDATHGTIWRREDDMLYPEIVNPRGTEVPAKRVGDGFVGLVAKEGTAKLFSDTQAQSTAGIHDRRDDEISHFQVVSMLAVPIEMEGRVTGVIQMLDDTPNKFDGEDEQTLRLIASETGLALEKYRVERQMEQLEVFRRRNSDLMDRIQSALLTEFDPDELLHVIMDSMLNVLDAAQATLYLVGKDELNFKVVIPKENAENLPPSLPLSGNGIAVRVALTGEPVILFTLDDDEVMEKLGIQRVRKFDDKVAFEPHSMICVPITTRNTVIGLIQLMDERPYHFSRSDFEIAKYIAATAGIALENAQQHDRRFRAERVAALNVMTSHMIHYFSNQVGLIRTTMGRVKKKFPDMPDDQWMDKNHAWMQERINRVIEAADKAIDYVDSIKKPIDSRITTVSVTDAIRAGMAKAARANVPVHIVTGLDEIEAMNLPHIQVVEEQIASVFRDLIKNAYEEIMKMGDSAVEPEVHVSATYDGLDAVTIYVQDNGPGIPVEDHERVFETYSTKEKGSLGIGLFLARFMVEVMHGSIYVDRNYTDGARFVIQLPAAQVAEEQAEGLEV